MISLFISSARFYAVQKTASGKSSYYQINSEFDSHTSVWYVCDSDVDGLHVEAETLEGLKEAIADALPELLSCPDGPETPQR